MTQRLRDVLGGFALRGGQVQSGHLLAAVMSGRANLCVPVTGRGELDAGHTGNPLSSFVSPTRADMRRLAEGGVAVEHNGA